MTKNLTKKLISSPAQLINLAHAQPLTLSLLQGRTQYVLFQITHILQGRTECVLKYSLCMKTYAHRENNCTASNKTYKGLVTKNTFGEKYMTFKLMICATLFY